MIWNKASQCSLMVRPKILLAKLKKNQVARPNLWLAFLDTMEYGTVGASTFLSHFLVDVTRDQ